MIIITIDPCVNLHFCEVWIKTIFFYQKKENFTTAFTQNSARLPGDFKWEAL